MEIHLCWDRSEQASEIRAETLHFLSRPITQGCAGALRRPVRPPLPVREQPPLPARSRGQPDGAPGGLQRCLSASAPRSWHVCTLRQAAKYVEGQVYSQQRRRMLENDKPSAIFPLLKGSKLGTDSQGGHGEGRNELLASLCWWKCHHHCRHKAYLPH